MGALIFDGVNLSDYMHAECARPLMASPAVSTTTVAGRDGFEVSSVKLESFDVGVECYVLPDFPLDDFPPKIRDGIRRADAIKRIVAAKLYRKSKRPLIFDDDPTRYNMSIVTGVSDPERIGYVDYFTVTFKCDPISYAIDETERSLVSGANSLVVNGTLPTFPTFEITANSNAVTLTKGDGQLVKAECSSGSVVRFDMERKRATVNGSDVRVALPSRFFRLDPGDNTVRVAGGSGVVRYREAWL